MDQNNNRKSGMDLGNTQYFKVQPDQETGVKKILSVVYEALLEKGYDPDLYHQLYGCEKSHHEGGA